MTTFHVITLFPDAFESYLGVSIVKRAQERKLIAVRYYNPRDFAVGKFGRQAKTYAERRVDDRPYGGGPGMVIEALPVIRAIEKAIGKKSQKPKAKIIFFTPAGKQFANETADSYMKYSDIVLICGRYEGIDARVKKVFPMAEISVGPFTVTGGELPAMIIIDAVTRRIPGALGHDQSVEETRLASPDVYTRPEVFEYKKKKYRVPKILLSGHHAKMDEWKKERRR
ncbi:MAG: tRNA (guanosine(37)-N1)-methyltransferase TrmD [Patescibacteria group bacterium]|nr:tRNA (guanosine(37)-N1)-methyltransferase TrmD [Patescibacteria group bacterium]MDE2172722.1 tRNA (guanosine(37)-N1)-methyltransferase TrmD [Patescibacteria group bacterium]